MSDHIFFTEVQGTEQPIKKHPPQFGHSGTAKNCAFHLSSASVWVLPWLRWLVSSLSSQMPSHPMWDLWWTDWHQNRYTSDWCGMPLSVWCHQCSTFIHCSITRIMSYLQLIKQQYAFNPMSGYVRWDPQHTKHSMLGNVAHSFSNIFNTIFLFLMHRWHHVT
jgi:hypothetical protein